jgi:diguanylate cyclase (GGDEF)-like protein
MTARGGGWATQQLAEFVAVVTTAADEHTAIRFGVERVAEALDADAAALMSGRDLAHSVGWPVGAAPVEVLRAVMLATKSVAFTVPVPGLGDVRIATIDVSSDGGSRLIVARASEPLDPEEKGLLRAMARTLDLAVRNHEVVGALRERQRLLEGLSEIQRSIARRTPLHQVLHAIVALAREIFDESESVLMLRDPDDPDSLVVAASTGLAEEVLLKAQRRKVGEGVSGQAVLHDRLFAADRYDEDSAAMSVFVEAGLTHAMAAPVHEDGAVVGSLSVGGYQRGRRYSPADQSLLSTLAQQASLALTDARIVSDMIHQALHDPLTGMPNRTLFGDRLAHALQRTERTASEVAVLFVDLDRFKPVNDSLGHAAGDELLQIVGQRICQCLRDSDTAARLGGDEFAVLLEDLVFSDDATGMAERIIEAVGAPVALQGREVFVGASVGVAMGRRGPDDLLRKADVAMYRAKANGKGRLVLYDPGMQGESLRRLELEADLRHALDRGEFELFYQPIVRLESGALHGMEALLRWHHPERGLIGPLDFIPVAEETGLIVPIGRWVLETACRQLGAWRAAGAPSELMMNVNLSGRQLDDPALRVAVAEAVAQPGIGPGALVLEITETVLMHDTETTIERLRELRELGVLLAVDDFGTGYSSLRHLDHFPVDLLKMARPFVERLDRGSDIRALAQTIIDLGANLGLPVVAEGIERAEQLAELRLLGCELGQGFHFGVPAPAAEVESLILAGELLG